MAKRGAALELAVLGLLHDAPMHGYELRKELIAVLGWTRVLSYGTLYPCLKALGRVGYIVADTAEADAPRRREVGAPKPPAPPGRRNRIVYKLTPEGKEQFAALLAESGPSAWDDENFGVHFAFFARTDARTRVRILEGRRSRLEERLENVRSAEVRSRERVDAYTQELHRHGLESVEREVRWLSDLIDSERAVGRPVQATTTNKQTKKTARKGNPTS